MYLQACDEGHQPITYSVNSLADPCPLCVALGEIADYKRGFGVSTRRHDEYPEPEDRRP